MRARGSTQVEDQAGRGGAHAKGMAAATAPFQTRMQAVRTPARMLADSCGGPRGTYGHLLPPAATVRRADVAKTTSLNSWSSASLTSLACSWGFERGGGM